MTKIWWVETLRRIQFLFVQISISIIDCLVRKFSCCQLLHGLQDLHGLQELIIICSSTWSLISSLQVKKDQNRNRIHRIVWCNLTGRDAQQWAVFLVVWQWKLKAHGHSVMSIWGKYFLRSIEYSQSFEIKTDRF